MKYYCHVISWTFFTIHPDVGSSLDHQSFSHLDSLRIVRHDFETYVINYLSDLATLNAFIYCLVSYTLFIPVDILCLPDNYFVCVDKVVDHVNWGFTSVTCLKVDPSYCDLVVSSCFQKEHLFPMVHFANNLVE